MGLHPDCRNGVGYEVTEDDDELPTGQAICSELPRRCPPTGSASTSSHKSSQSHDRTNSPCQDGACKGHSCISEPPCDRPSDREILPSVVAKALRQTAPYGLVRSSKWSLPAPIERSSCGNCKRKQVLAPVLHSLLHDSGKEINGSRSWRTQRATERTMSRLQHIPHTEASMPKHFKFLYDICVNKDTGTPTDYSRGLKTAREAEQLMVPQIENEREAAQNQDLDETGHANLNIVKTGLDAVKFFARHGNTTKTKFLFCNRAPTAPLVFEPYRLVVVPPNQVNPEHFTLSATAVMHICPGKPTECFRQDEWMRQAFVYSLLRTLSFFKTFVTRKVVSLWVHASRKHAFEERREMLCKTLFIAKPTYCDYLSKIHKVLAGVGALKLIELQPAIYSISQFTEQQRVLHLDQKVGASKKLEAKHKEARAHLLSLEQKLEEATQLPEAEPMHAHPFSKGRSIFQAKRDAAEQKRLLKVAYRDQALLGQFILLADLIFTMALAKATIKAAAAMVERIGTEEACAKLFSVNVSFGNTKVNLEPGRADFISMLHELWDGIVTTVSSVSLLAQCRQFEDCALKGPQMTVESLLLHSKHLQLMKKRIEERLLKDFDRAQKYSESYFGIYRQIYDYGQNWDETAFANATTSHDDLSTEMEMVSEFEDKLDKLNPVHVVGLFSIEARNLKCALQPITEKALSFMKRLLWKLMKDHVRNTASRFEDINKRLDERPMNLARFASFLCTCKEIKSQIDELDRDKAAAEDMFALLKQYGVRLAVEDTIHLENMLKSASEFEKSKLLDAAEHIRCNLEVMKADLKARTEEVENEMEELNKLISDEEFGTLGAWKNAARCFEQLKEYQQRISLVYEKAESLRVMRELFSPDIPAVISKQIQEAVSSIEPKVTMWQHICSWQCDTGQWLGLPLAALNAEAVDGAVKRYLKEACAAVQSFPSDLVATEFKKEVEGWLKRLPLIVDLSNPAMKRLHWETVFQELKMNGTEDSVCLGQLYQEDILSKRDFINEISTLASMQQSLQQTIDKIVQIWGTRELLVKPLEEDPNALIFEDVAELLSTIEDHQISMQRMLHNPYIGVLKQKVESWAGKLDSAQQILEELIQLQGQWIKLQGVFSNMEILEQLPEESELFEHVDSFWRAYLRKIRSKAASLITVVEEEGLLEILGDKNKILADLQRKVEDCLDSKRMAFPRFYFLSNEELLNIVSKAKQPAALQESFQKCFDGLQAVALGANGTVIKAVYSQEREKIDLLSPVNVLAPVEQWFASLEEAIVNSLRRHSKAALENQASWEIDLQDRMGMYPSQCIVRNEMISWCSKIEEALEAVCHQRRFTALEDCLKACTKEIQRLAQLNVYVQASLLRRVAQSLLIFMIHARDILHELQQSKIPSPICFEWKKHLRYYWNCEEGECDIEQLQAKVVVTPLTDKCFMALTSAFHLGYGGALFGPSGTGKTESVKELAMALGVSCQVFDCSKELDICTVSRHLKGLAQTGIWACFNEFNRIGTHVSSIVAQLLLRMQTAIRAQKDLFEFDGKSTAIDPRLAICMTNNPSSAGRTELPGILQSVFRPMSMITPDYTMIAEVTLFVNGFLSAPSLAAKVVHMFSVANVLLSQQKHYDWGLRSLKAVLLNAGKIKTKQLEIDETKAMVEALQSVLPSLVVDDIPIYLGLISDIFSQQPLSKSNDIEVEVEFEAILREQHLQALHSFVEKGMQLYEAQLLRHSLLVVGAPGVGKTTLLVALSKAISRVHMKAGTTTHSSRTQHEHVAPDRFCKVLRVYSKALEESLLFGKMDPNTTEWIDGIIPARVREAAAAQSDIHSWLVFDGPLDAIWAENLHSALDDNKTLYLCSGERIALPENFKIFFEVAWATPYSFSCLASYVCRLLTALLSGKVPQSITSDLLENLAQMYFVFAMAWGLGGHLADVQRADLSNALQPEFSKICKLLEGLPNNISIYNILPDTTNLKFETFDSMVPQYSFESGVKFSDIFVPTARTVAHSFFQQKLVEGGYSCFIAGKSGTGKSIHLQQCIKTPTPSIACCKMALAYRTTTQDIEDFIVSHFVKHHRRSLGPPHGFRMLLFIDDLAAPAPDNFGTKRAHQLIRQIVESGGFYERTHHHFIRIEDTSTILISNANVSGLSIDMRLLRHFNILYYDEYAPADIKHVFARILKGTWERTLPMFSHCADILIDATVVAYQRIKAHLLPTPLKCHYSFTMREISRAVEGMLMADTSRESLSRLATAIMDYTDVTMSTISHYGPKDLQEYLRDIIIQICTGKRDFVFRISESSVKYDEWFQDITSIIATGEIHGLFNQPEKEKLSLQVGVMENPEAVGASESWHSVVALVQSRLHFLVNMSASGETFRAICRSMAHLVNACVIDYYDSWPRSALHSIAMKLLEKASPISRDVAPMLSSASVEIYSAIEGVAERYTAVTGESLHMTRTSFVELVKHYLFLLAEKKQELDERLQKYASGISKLEETSAAVKSMKAQLLADQPILEKAKEEAELVEWSLAADDKVRKNHDDSYCCLPGILKATDGPAADMYPLQSEVLMGQRYSFEKSAAESADINAQWTRDECQQDVRVVLPLLHQAFKALEALDEQDIQELKSLTSPIALVEAVMNAVCVLLGRKVSWEDGKQLLDDASLITTLRHYDKDHVPPKLMQQLSMYTSLQDFAPEKVVMHSKAAASLCMWVRAVESYVRALNNMDPKQPEHTESNQVWNQADGSSEETKPPLEEVQARVQSPVEQYDARRKRVVEMERQMHTTAQRLAQAENLLSRISVEGSRWASNVKILEEDISYLLTDVLIAAGMLNYAGPFTREFREELLCQWLAMCRDEGLLARANFSLAGTLSTPSEIRQWALEELPSDVTSIENAILVCNCVKCPLLIDPEDQGTHWLRRRQYKTDFKEIYTSNPNFLQTLCEAVTAGMTVLITISEEGIDSAIKTLIEAMKPQKDTPEDRSIIRLTHHSARRNPYFRMVLVTKQSPTEVIDELHSDLCVINFRVTPASLEEQILNQIVMHEAPHLEEQRKLLAISIARDLATGATFQEKILALLADAKGDILTDNVFLESLNECYSGYEAIQRRTNEAFATADKLEEARRFYKSLAERGALLYCLLCDLSHLNALYQWSFEIFKVQVQTSLQNCQDASENRVEILKDLLTWEVYCNTCRGLMDTHRLAFAFMIAKAIDVQAGNIPVSMLEFFIKEVTGRIEGESTGIQPHWTTLETWRNIIFLDQIIGGPFQGFARLVAADDGEWRTIIENDDKLPPHLPRINGGDLRPFESLVLIKAIRKRELHAGCREYVQKILGSRYICPIKLDLPKAVEESTPLIPLIFIELPGSDLIGSIRIQAARASLSQKHLHILSLGQGQDAAAENTLQEARVHGYWVFLQICHLEDTLVHSLQRFCEELRQQHVHPRFRLFIATQPNHHLPSSILKQSIKILAEPPSGLRENVMQTFYDLERCGADDVSHCPSYKRWLFALALFHSFILERRRYGILGWNKAYAWTFLDFKISQQGLYESAAAGEHDMAWDKTLFLTAEIYYGGRVTDSVDQRVLTSLLKRCISANELGSDAAETVMKRYVLPSDYCYQDITEFVMSLPIDPEPEDLGLDRGAVLMYKELESNKLFDCLVNVHRGIQKCTGNRRESNLLSIISDMLYKLPADISTDKATGTVFQPHANQQKGFDGLSPLDVFLKGEVQAYNMLLACIRKCLTQLQEALRGREVMTEELENLSKMVYLQRVPTSWIEVSYPTKLSLGWWLEDLGTRITSIQQWVQNGPPAVFNIATFHKPQRFFIATLTALAKGSHGPLTALSLSAKITDIKDITKVKAPADIGTYINGLSMQGANWSVEDQVLCEAKPRVMFHELPPILLTAHFFFEEQRKYRCPVYRTTDRSASSEVVAFLDLPTDDDPEKWIQRGVAMLIDTGRYNGADSSNN
ncbi:hypothetical protein cyc_04028 [Cyclospora cayetanensis]|uniref:Dynein heavy chain, cytoplasmic n=1 Tax=Cyclospora cayetanensis TaxID=88456 RepID=A0A1D3CX91_9EIME|nr:hypothetical protein cyc_04028 [Cyclospora cayetanensis]